MCFYLPKGLACCAVCVPHFHRWRRDNPSRCLASRSKGETDWMAGNDPSSTKQHGDGALLKKKKKKENVSLRWKQPRLVAPPPATGWSGVDLTEARATTGKEPAFSGSSSVQNRTKKKTQPTTRFTHPKPILKFQISNKNKVERKIRKGIHKPLYSYCIYMPLRRPRKKKLCFYQLFLSLSLSFYLSPFTHKRIPTLSLSLSIHLYLSPYILLPWVIILSLTFICCTTERELYGWGTARATEFLGGGGTCESGTGWDGSR